MPARYVRDVAEAIRALTGDHQPEKERLYAMYALLALTKGESVTAADVHDAWCAASLGDTAVEFDALPFDELSEELKRRDEPFATAIRAVARDRSQGATTRPLRSPSTT